MLGLFPPSSSDTGTSRSAPARPMIRPTSGLPVKASFATPGCEVSAAPTSSPNPGTTLITPGGKMLPAISANASVDSEAFSSGLSTTVLPAATAGATFRATINAGTFQE